MLDMGFLPSVKKIVAATPRTRQTLLFSATIDKSILSVVGSMLSNPATVEIARKGTVAETVDQYIIRTPQSVKPALIKAVLAENGADRVIVFTRTRNRADSTCRRLRKAGYLVEAIHSDRSQGQRRRALDKFSAGEVNIITATDVLARGIDVDLVDYVINYDAPEQAEDYIHRIGRTGRAGQAGFAVTFVTPENSKELHDIEKLVKKTIPEMQLANFDMAQAQAEAAEAAITMQSKRDPEVNRVKRELANKAQAKAERTTKHEPASKAKAKAEHSAKLELTGKARKSAAKASKTGASKATGTNRPAKAAKAQATPKAAKPGKTVRTPKPAGKHKPQGKTHAATPSVDVRPGRARRAEMKRAHDNRRKHR